jgi:thiamine biosynthesis lipoprotein
MVFEFEAIGTHWKIEIEDDQSNADWSSVRERILKRIDIFDKHYSRFRNDSLVTEMSQRAGTYTLPTDAAPLFRLYHETYQITGGLVTPLIGQVLVDAGYDAHYSLKPGVLRRPPSWEEVLDFQPPETLVLKQPALLDVGAFGKGYLVDIVAALLWDDGFRSFCVDAGGDMLRRDAAQRPLRVGLEHPQDVSKAIGVATFTEGAFCGSAGNRRVWADFHHIINPKTLTSPRDIIAVWTMAKTTMLADAMATCLFFVPPEKLMKFYTFEYLVMYPDGSVKRSKGFPAELFIA